MTESDKKALFKLGGAKVSQRSTTDDLQSILLQIVLALLIVFIIAYFMFVADTKKEREEQVIDLNRQKIILALDKAVEDRHIKYGLNALMTQGTDGNRIFDAQAHVQKGSLEMTPAAKTAFSTGSQAAYSDYQDVAKLQQEWTTEVLQNAGIDDISDEEKLWLDEEVSKRVEAVRLNVRGVQRALAARLQRSLIENSSSFNEFTDANALAEAIKIRSLDILRQFIASEVLP